MKTILVTGGAGFLGSHLCDALIQKGDFVICLDNLFTGSCKNIEHLMSNKNFQFVEHDIVNPIKIADKKIDQIYNLACPASPVHYQLDAIQTVKANTVGVINVLELAKDHSARVLQSSTSEIYGDPEVHPQTESYRGNVNTIGPRACYDEGKRVAETLFFDYHRKFGLEIRVARIFNTYGPRMAKNDGRVVSNFIVQALQNEEITVYGNGKQTRSFCFVSNLIDGLISLMNVEDFTGPVNLGNPTEKTILQIAETIIAMAGSHSKIVNKPLPQDDPKQRRPDIALAAAKLQWRPEIDLERGLRETIDYFKKVI